MNNITMNNTERNAEVSTSLDELATLISTFDPPKPPPPAGPVKTVRKKIQKYQNQTNDDI